MQDSQIEEIKNKLNILDVVGSYVKLTKTGINYRGICPFHSEKGPSFFVSPARQMFKCFGCSASGDVFEFVKKIEGVEFGDALRILAQKAGVELKRENPQIISERKRLYEICNLACSFFEKQLQASLVGKEAKEYLLKRGISEDSIKKWRLGYSPDTWQGLSDFLVGRGYNREEIVKAGLAVQSEKGNNPYDRFRGRIIFPIFDLNSQPIGFGARIFKSEDSAKYINTPQTLLYDKSNVLYGINFAKVSVRKNNQCVLTEGYTDAIMCHQAGFENTVAVSGTALTQRHLSILKRYSDNLILAFDMDLAGDTATKKGINLAESAGFNIKIINKYSEKDPAEIILENPKNWEDSVQKARTIMDYYFDSAFSAFDKNIPENKKQIGKIILPAIKRIQNKIEQSHWIQKLSQKLDIRDEAIIEELKNINLEKNNFIENKNLKEPKLENTRKNLIEQKIIALVVKDPENLNLIEEKCYPLFCEETRTFLQNFKENPNTTFANEAAFKGEVEFLEDGAKELELCLFQLKKLELKNELGRLSGVIKDNLNQPDEYLKEFEKKAKEFHYEKN